MIPILLILGAGAALELKRLTHQGRGNEEQRLKDILQALKKELEAERQERAAEKARQEALEQELGELATQKDELQAAAEGLKSENEDLRGRAEALAQSAESLLAEKSAALQQLERLRVESAEGSKRAAASAAQLREDIAEALEAFSAGDLDADALLDELQSLGVHVECSAEALTLTAPSAGREEGAPPAAPITGSWSQSMRLVCGSSERMAQLIAAGSLNTDGEPGRALAALGAGQQQSTGAPPLLGLPSTMSALTPRMFANSDNLPTKAALLLETQPLADKAQEPVITQGGKQDNTISMDANATSLLFKRLAKAGPSKKPPMVPRLGLNLALRGSSGPASERMTLAYGADAADQQHSSKSLTVRS